MLPAVLQAYGFNADLLKAEAFGSGLINHTWKVTAGNKTYILQKINEAVFKAPQNIAHNISVAAHYLQQHHPQYMFTAPVPSVAGDEMIFIKDEGYFRLFPFVPNSHSIDVVQTPVQAYEAAAQFGRFTHLLSGLDVTVLKVTIPHFHDLALRYRQFLTALQNGNPARVQEAKDLINTLQQHAGIVKTYGQLTTDPEFRLRVTHHDTKISNVLFDGAGKGLCVIDLDTVMPGYFISDVGDMMRTYLSPVSEEEKDLHKIEVRDDFYIAIVQGYLSQMKNELTVTEMQYLFYAGTFMIYMQALRFLTDHLNDDVYYGAQYEGHNFMRAKNQTVLLQRLLQKEAVLANYAG